MTAMKQDPHSPGDPELRAVLQTWQEPAPLPPGFPNRVWRRIELEQRGQHGSASFWASLMEGWEAFVRNPVGAAACLAACVVLGLGLGLWHAEAYTARAEMAWQNAYFQSVSPTLVSLRE